MTLETVGIAAVVAAMLLTAFLAALETVVNRLSVVRALRISEEGLPGSDALLWIMERRATTMNVVLVTTVLTRVAAAAVITAMAIDGLGAAAAIGLAVALIGVLGLIATEVVPRTLVLRDLEQAGRSIARPARVLVQIASPAARLLVALGRSVPGRGAAVSGPFPDDEELRAVIAAIEDDQDHAFDQDERAMIRSVIELGDTVVREIMTPRPDMITVGEDAPIGEVVNLVIEHGYSRLPVTRRDDADDIVGVVHAKDILRRLALKPNQARWGDLVRDHTFVPELQRTDDLLRTLRGQAIHQAIVVDEYGAISGLVTIEDILEEIVGEIVDEHDNEEPLVVIEGDGRMRIDARLPMDDFNELTGQELPDEGWDTVGGLVVGMLGHVPDEGETIELGPVAIEVVRMQGRRVGEVIVGERDTERLADGVAIEATTTSSDNTR